MNILISTNNDAEIFLYQRYLAKSFQHLEPHIDIATTLDETIAFLEKNTYDMLLIDSVLNPGKDYSNHPDNFNDIPVSNSYYDNVRYFLESSYFQTHPIFIGLISSFPKAEVFTHSKTGNKLFHYFTYKPVTFGEFSNTLVEETYSYFHERTR